MGHALGMDTTEADQILDRFRREVYRDVLGRRKDSLFGLMEAALVADGPRTLVRLSLEPVFGRRWPSACDALADGALDGGALRKQLAAALVPPPAGARPVWAADGTTWPRRASPSRGWCPAGSTSGCSPCPRRRAAGPCPWTSAAAGRRRAARPSCSSRSSATSCPTCRP